MTARAVPRRKARPAARKLWALPFAGAAVLMVAAAAYVLWPTWPDRPIAADVPAFPIAVAGVLFQIPPGSIREAVQRHPGEQERVDLAFVWPSLAPPPANDKPDAKTALNAANAAAAAAEPEDERLFVEIAALGNELPPLERLRTIYSRYAESQASAGPDGLAVLPFRSGTPYDGEDLVYVGANPEQFFALCTRTGRAVPGTCIHQRLLDAAEITFRFPRDWFGDWRDIAGGFDRLMARLHPQQK